MGHVFGIPHRLFAVAEDIIIKERERAWNRDHRTRTLFYLIITSLLILLYSACYMTDHKSGATNVLQRLQI